MTSSALVAATSAHRGTAGLVRKKGTPSQCKALPLADMQILTSVACLRKSNHAEISCCIGFLSGCTDASAAAALMKRWLVGVHAVFGTPRHERHQPGEGPAVARVEEGGLSPSEWTARGVVGDSVGVCMASCMSCASQWVNPYCKSSFNPSTINSGR